jgi:hypothetical protein
MIETWGKNRRELRNKDSKLEILQKLSTKFETKTLDIGSMTSKDLRNILKTQPLHEVNSVDSRFKRDYILELSKAYPEVKSFEKAPISGLRNLITCHQKKK